MVQAAAYVILANQFVAAAYFADKDRYAELYKTNKEMTEWMISRFDRLQIEF